MNIFAHLIRLEEFQFRKVKYYSVQIEGNEVNEFYDFLNRMEDIRSIENDLSNLMVWIEEIGENYGAQQKFFRNESEIADVRALPPPRTQMRLRKIEVNEMRLYCMVLNEHVVIFFNGGIKTTDKAQQCPNVGPYFKQANKLTLQLDQLLKDGEIIWNSNFTDIKFDTNLEIEL